MNINGVKVLKFSKKTYQSNNMKKIFLFLIILSLSNSCSKDDVKDEEYYLNYWELYKYKHTEAEMMEMHEDINELYITDSYVIDTLFVRNNELISNCKEPVIRYLNKKNYNNMELNKIKNILKIDSLELLDSIIYENKIYHIPKYVFFSDIQFENKTYIKKTFAGLFEIDKNPKNSQNIIYETIEEFGIVHAYTEYNKNARPGYYTDVLSYRLIKKVHHKKNKDSVVFDLTDMKLKY